MQERDGFKQFLARVRSSIFSRLLSPYQMLPKQQKTEGGSDGTPGTPSTPATPGTPATPAAAASGFKPPPPRTAEPSIQEAKQRYRVTRHCLDVWVLTTAGLRCWRRTLSLVCAMSR